MIYHQTGNRYIPRSETHVPSVNSNVTQLTVRKTRPPLVTVVMTDKQCCSHTTRVLTQ